MKNKPDIALVVLCKNEEKTIPRLLASVEGIVSRLIFFDTGSGDNTVRLLKTAGADVLEGTFEDFGKSRTRLMEFAKDKAEWLLLMDCDQTLKVEGTALPPLDSAISAYSPAHSGSNRYFIPRLVRGDRKWRFVGATHEYLDGAGPPVVLPGVYVEHHADGGARYDKLARDHRLLLSELERDPANARALFYLANTERDMGLLNSARTRFLERAAMGGWQEEVFSARLEAAKISLDPLELWEVWASRPTRAEPLYWLSRVYAASNISMAKRVNGLRESIPTPDDILFVDMNTYGPQPSALQPFHPWMKLPGWFDYADVYEKFVERFPGSGAQFVEVGVWVGRSFAAMDYFAKKMGKLVRLHAVDTFKGSQCELAEKAAADFYYAGDFRAEFEANMKRCGVSNFETIPKTSVEAAEMFADLSVDVVFIDAEHSYEAVRADIAAWLPKVQTANGIIAGHDYDRPEVKEAVLSYFDEAEVVVRGRTWVVQLGA